MLIKTVGIVTKVRDVSERDRIVTILTKEHGIIDAFVKGAKSSKNVLTAGTQILTYAEFCLYKGKSGYSVNSCDVINLFYNLRLDVVNLSVALYFCDLLNFCEPTGENLWEIIRLSLNSFHLLEKGAKSTELIKAILEMRLMSLSGFQPSLLGCKECLCYDNEQMYFLPMDGSLICKDCLQKVQEDTVKYTLNSAILHALRHIVLSDTEKLFKFSLKGDSLKQLNFICENYCLCTTQRRFKSLDMYYRLKIQ